MHWSSVKRFDNKKSLRGSDTVDLSRNTAGNSPEASQFGISYDKGVTIYHHGLGGEEQEGFASFLVVATINPSQDLGPSAFYWSC